MSDAGTKILGDNKPIIDIRHMEAGMKNKAGLCGGCLLLVLIRSGFITVSNMTGYGREKVMCFMPA